MQSSPRVFLQRDKERPVLARHPWIFSGAVDRVEGEPADGETVAIVSADGRSLGRGYYNSRSQIRVRVWTLEDVEIDRELLARRLELATRSRERLGLRFGAIDTATSAFRLVNAESDQIPGLIVDAYGRFLVIQCLTAGIERRKAELCELLAAAFAPDGIWERSDVDVREKEGLEQARGCRFGAEPPARLEIRESGHRFLCDLHAGQKTGFYLDQRENRRRVAGLAATLSTNNPGGSLEVLNAFCYSGAFGVQLASAHPGAQILNLDASSEALELAHLNFELAGLAGRDETICGDAFQELRKLRDVGRSFDLVVLDPPKFAHAKSGVVAACRGYKDLNLLACKLLRPGGYLATFSCSGLVGPELFQKVVFDGAHDAGRYASAIAKLGAGPDHPLLLSFPEGEYLKGLLVEVR
jgi:23S rRNA (cytosine1962-C5)-methyltransferase